MRNRRCWENDAISNVLPVTNATLNVDYAVFVELGYVATSLWRQYGLATPEASVLDALSALD